MSVTTRVNNHLSDLRTIMYLIQGNQFREVYESLNTQQRGRVDAMIDKCRDVNPQTREESKRQLKDWLRQNDTSNLSTLRLKELCQTYGVPHWARMNKIELLTALRAAKDRYGNTTLSRSGEGDNNPVSSGQNS